MIMIATKEYRKTLVKWCLFFFHSILRVSLKIAIKNVSKNHHIDDNFDLNGVTLSRLLSFSRTRVKYLNDKHKILEKMYICGQLCIVA